MIVMPSLLQNQFPDSKTSDLKCAPTLPPNFLYGTLGLPEF